MPIEIKVAPPGITISQGRTFMVANSGGEIKPQTDEGVFAIDTRFISYYQFFINRIPWVLVSSSLFEVKSNLSSSNFSKTHAHSQM
ncbi:MAG TPA: glycogen debranching N-terminal domain-containing protein [Ktedonobacteraceae bacterium]